MLGSKCSTLSARLLYYPRHYVMCALSKRSMLYGHLMSHLTNQLLNAWLHVQHVMCTLNLLLNSQLNAYPRCSSYMRIQCAIKCTPSLRCNMLQVNLVHHLMNN